MYFDDVQIGDEVTDIFIEKNGIVCFVCGKRFDVNFKDYGKYSYQKDGRFFFDEDDSSQVLFYKGYEPEINIPRPPKRNVLDNNKCTVVKVYCHNKEDAKEFCSVLKDKKFNMED